VPNLDLHKEDIYFYNFPQPKPQPVTWINTKGVSVDGNSLLKTNSTGWDGSGAISEQTIDSGDGHFKFSSNDYVAYFVGLTSENDNEGDRNRIDFAIHVDNDNTLYIYESGEQISSFGSYQSGDEYKVSIENGIVRYYHNDNLIYTSNKTPSFPLRVGVALYSNGSEINNAFILDK
jgi:hypothetical protein